MKGKRMSREERMKLLTLANSTIQLALDLVSKTEIERKPPSPERPKPVVLAMKRGAA